MIKWVIDTSACVTHSLQRKCFLGKGSGKKKKQIMDSGRNADLSCPRTVASSLLPEDEGIVNKALCQTTEEVRNNIVSKCTSQERSQK